MSQLARESLKLKKGKLALRFNRINWRVVTKHKIFSECNEFIKEATLTEYPFSLSVFQGSTDKNRETIQFNIGINHTGIETIKTEVTENGVDTIHSKIVESGCCLVFSQCPTGNIAIMIYPYKSDAIERKEDNIFLHVNLKPDQVTSPLINKSILQCLFYARQSSVFGLASKSTISDRFRMFLLNFKDIRAKNNRLKGFVNLSSEWWKIALTAVISIAVTLLASTNQAG